MSETEIDRLAKILWSYHKVDETIQKADVVLGLGSNDPRVAKRSAELFLEGYAPQLVFSGGVGALTEGMYGKSEAAYFADIAIEMGVPKEKILVEGNSTNTGENIQLTRQLLQENNLDPQSFIVVQKPYMERRAYATFKKNLPEKDLQVTSPQIQYEDYFTEDLTKDKIINIMVGDLQRIKEYPAKGFQIEQEIPGEVWNAYEELTAAGFTNHLIKE